VSEPQSVEILVEYTLADVREALMPPDGAKRDHVSRRNAVAFGWLRVLGAIGVWALLMFVPTFPGQKSDRVECDVAVLLATSIAPFMFVFGIVVARFVALAAAARLTGDGALKKRQSVVTLVQTVAGLFAAVGTLLALFPLIARDAELAWHTNRRFEIGAALAPWVLLMLLHQFLTQSMTKRAAEQRFKSSEILKRVQTLVLDEHGLKRSDEVGEVSYSWGCFRRARETATLLLIVDQQQRVHILPKRAFDDDFAIAMARALIQNHVKETQFLPQPSAFPVLPRASSNAASPGETL
jgi:hypothetical protein